MLRGVIDDGLRRVRALGLNNIELRRQSVTDVGVKDGRIVAVGPLPGARATRVVDATGRYVVTHRPAS